MIRGKYLTSRDDCAPVFEIRRRVFVEEQGFALEIEVDAADKMAVYALALDEAGEPVATGRLYISEDRFHIGRVCALKAYRGLGYGDFIMRMLLHKAVTLNAPSVYLHSQMPMVGFYERYGFKPDGGVILEEGVEHLPMAVRSDEILLDGHCAGCAANEK